MFDSLKKIFSSSRRVGSVPVANIQANGVTVQAGNASQSAAYKKQGNEYLAKGELKNAAECYRQAIAISHDNAEACINLGFVLKELKLYEEAERVLKQAILLNPKMEDAYYLLGCISQECGNLAEAIENYNKTLELKPDFEIVYRDLCLLLFQSGQIESAKKVIKQGISVNPESVEFHYYLGKFHVHERELELAIACYRKVLSIQPDSAEVYGLLGNIFKEQRNLDEAITCYQNALELNPGDANVFNNLGATCQSRGDFGEAEACYRKALMLKPDSVEANNNLGVVFRKQGNLNEAIACFRKALALRPEFSEAYNNLGSALHARGDLDEAAVCYSKVLVLQPDFSMAHYNLGILYQEQNDLDKALACYRQTVKLMPEFHVARINLLHMMQLLCDWKGLGALSEEGRRGVREISPTNENQIIPFSFLSLSGATAAEQLLCASNWAKCKYRSLTSLRKRMGFEFKRDPLQKIHIGYISADFRNHPVANLMAEIFELHDRDRFQISAYSYGPNDGGAMRKRLEKSFDNFVDIVDFTHERAAKKIYEDHVDVLVDLTGYTQFHRSEILALRPAPVQVSYLGYLGTMGADFMDYIIADSFLVPPGHEKYYSEKIAYLSSYQANDRSCVIAETPTRKSCSLPEEGFVFCCFNQTYKILPDVFDVWMRLLKAVPGSVFWVYASTPPAIANLRHEAQIRGVSPQRLIFAETLPLDQHLARMKCADLFLDTLPYNAGTTASNALWVGLPVITCAGETFSSRMAGSLLIAMGIPELIAYNLEDYYALALDLATNKKKYEHIRDKIRANRESAPLFDSLKFTRNLEAVYLQMWDEYMLPDEHQISPH